MGFRQNHAIPRFWLRYRAIFEALSKETRALPTLSFRSWAARGGAFDMARAWQRVDRKIRKNR